MAESVNIDTLKSISSKYEEFKTLVKERETRKREELGWECDPVKLKGDEIVRETEELLGGLERTNRYYPRGIAMKGTLLYEESKVLSEAGNEAVALEKLSEAHALLEEHADNVYVVYIYFRVSNHLSYFVQKRGRLSEAQVILERARDLYETLKSSRCYGTEELFAPEVEIESLEETTAKFEKLVTNNLQMLGYVYNMREDEENFARSHHLVLRRQLEMSDGDPLLWVQKALQLSKFFIVSQNFREARHHLAASYQVIETIKKTAGQKTEEVESRSDEEEGSVKAVGASLASVWVKYGLSLFAVSKRRIAEKYLSEDNDRMNRLWDSTYDQKESQFPEREVEGGEKAKEEEEEGGGAPAPAPAPAEAAQKPDTRPAAPYSEGLTFPSLDLSNAESQVAAEVIETVYEARALFIYTLAWLKEAKSYFTFSNHPQEYMSCMMDLSELYRSIAFYETDWDEQYKIHRQRQEVLETLSCILKELDSGGSNIDAQVELLRELAEVHIELLTLNLHQMSILDGAHEVSAHKAEAYEDLQARLEGLGDSFSPEPGDDAAVDLTDNFGDSIKAFQD